MLTTVTINEKDYVFNRPVFQISRFAPELLVGIECDMIVSALSITSYVYDFDRFILINSMHDVNGAVKVEKTRLDAYNDAAKELRKLIFDGKLKIKDYSKVCENLIYDMVGQKKRMQ